MGNKQQSRILGRGSRKEWKGRRQWRRNKRTPFFFLAPTTERRCDTGPLWRRLCRNKDPRARVSPGSISCRRPRGRTHAAFRTPRRQPPPTLESFSLLLKWVRTQCGRIRSERARASSCDCVTRRDVRVDSWVGVGGEVGYDDGSSFFLHPFLFPPCLRNEVEGKERERKRLGRDGRSLLAHSRRRILAPRLSRSAAQASEAPVRL